MNAIQKLAAKKMVRQMFQFAKKGIQAGMLPEYLSGLDFDQLQDMVIQGIDTGNVTGISDLAMRYIMDNVPLINAYLCHSLAGTRVSFRIENGDELYRIRESILTSDAFGSEVLPQLRIRAKENGTDVLFELDKLIMGRLYQEEKPVLAVFKFDQIPDDPEIPDFLAKEFTLWKMEEFKNIQLGPGETQKRLADGGSDS